MNGANTIILLDRALALAVQLQEVNRVIRQAQTEGRDVTDAEIDTMIRSDLESEARLQALIDKKTVL